MPATAQAPEQQLPMEAVGANAVVVQQPTSEPQPQMTLRGGEEAACECCCCGCEESCC
ncbi:9353b79d-4638-45dc-9fba-869991f7c998 [Thermothielavioides terrestris]|uniref:Uncharacterized protein n=2 Tax=Thermothielavioides terrestris TaxID=2587410 RepID=G2QWK8_THETT|nr:uncharacterized protein THITE_2111130 [Thermothielavioides terrestris NRRL 8126]AEO64783.1 hypothetical protein THITE_2111130 [Thermothielavioides terrestris NRRL 8126]SPQ20728.1 9353b79d-4638-45dc-9fba-869991f7c998 [Thermothielavioides terrestris]